LAKKQNEQKKQYCDYHQFCTCQTLHFLVKVFTFFSLFQPPKTFPHVLQYLNLSKTHSENFFPPKNISSKKNYSFFFFDYFFFLNFVLLSNFLKHFNIFDLLTYITTSIFEITLYSLSSITTFILTYL
jgi:hypothetical protein